LDVLLSLEKSLFLLEHKYVLTIDFFVALYYESVDLLFGFLVLLKRAYSAHNLLY
jgi:hypothetical protein